MKTERDIFVEALEIETPEAREVYLQAACGEDCSLRQRVDELLDEHFATDGPLAGPALHRQPQERNRADRPFEISGQLLGRYKLLEKIGEGGFGDVWMAEQREPVKRRVALKIIKLGMDTKQVVARFEAERQAVAMMDHSNIARIFDAGTTDNGRPFFVMELVRGIPITEFCDQQNLNTEERLRLFVDVCDAVQHAHQKGVIHRDLKPSNVLVTMHGEKRVPKVIDFGVAKATQQELTDKTLYTRFDQFLGTPAYMSPEQTHLSGLDIDTRSDIYSLGVLLYELLAGSPPFDPKTLAAAGHDEVRRIIREVEPPKPSTRLAALGRHRLTDLAKHRRMDAGKLGTRLKGDLDWIVMKALEKDRSRRYDSASGLAHDIERALVDQPVLAGPPGLAYQLHKMVRRHRTLVGVAAVVVAILAISSVVFYHQAARQKKLTIEAEQTGTALRAARNELRTQFEETDAGRRQASFRLADQDLRSGKTSLGIAKLARLLRDSQSHPRFNIAVAERLLSALWQRDHPRPLTPPLTHPGYQITCAALSRDGHILVTSGTDEMLKVWDTRTGTMVNERKVANLRPRLEISPDGQIVAVAVDNGPVLLWHPREGMETLLDLQLEDVRPFTFYVEVIRFSLDGTKVLVGGGDVLGNAAADNFRARGFAGVWDVANGKQLTQPLWQHRNMVAEGAACWSADGTRVATGSDDGTARVWDIVTGEPVSAPMAHGLSVWSVQFSPDGMHLLTGCQDGLARIWDLRSGSERVRMAHGDRVQWAEYDALGEWVVTASRDGTARIWEASTGRPLTEPLHHGARVDRARFSPDRTRVITASADGSARIWNALTGDSMGPALPHGLGVADAWFCDGGKNAFTWGGDFARVWDLSLSGPRELIYRHPIDGSWTNPQGIRSMAFHPASSRFVAAGDGGELMVWDAVTGSLLHKFFASWCDTLEFSPDGDLLVGAGRGLGCVAWSLKLGTVKWKLHGGHGEKVTEQAEAGRFSPDGKLLATMGPRWDSNLNMITGGFVKIWDVSSSVDAPKLIADHTIENALALGAYWSPGAGNDRRLLVGLGDLPGVRPGNGQSVIWDLNDLQKPEWIMLKSPAADSRPQVRTGRWHPDGSRVFIGFYNGDLQCWDTSHGRLLASVNVHRRLISQLEVSADGRFLVVATDEGRVEIWHARDLTQTRFALQHDDRIRKTAISPDGKRAATIGENDGLLRIWDLQSGLPLSEPLELGSPGNVLKFSPDGRKLLAGNTDGGLKLWDVPSILDAIAVPVPDWLPDWAEAVAGLRIDVQGAAIPAPQLGKNVARLTPTDSADRHDPYAIIRDWVDSTPSQRSASPFSGRLTRQFLANRLCEAFRLMKPGADLQAMKPSLRDVALHSTDLGGPAASLIRRIEELRTKGPANPEELARDQSAILHGFLELCQTAQSADLPAESASWLTRVTRETMDLVAKLEARR